MVLGRFGRKGRAGAPAGSGAAGTIPPAIPVDPLVNPEEGVPRWRRQSLMAARKGIPVPDRGDEHQRFEAAPELEGVERRLVRYRLVSLLDIPDEVRGTEVSVLDEGDEVVVLERRGMQCRVRCPDGREGWVHRMTLGDLVTPSPAPVPAPPDAPDPDRSDGSTPDSAPVVADRPGDEVTDGGGSEPRADGDEAYRADDLEPASFEEILLAARRERETEAG